MHLRPWRNRQYAWILPHPWWALPPCVASAGRSAIKQRFTGRWGCVLVLWFCELCSLVRQLPILRRNIMSPSSGLKSWKSLPDFRINTAYWVTSGFRHDVNEIGALLRFYAMQNNPIRTFRDNLSGHLQGSSSLSSWTAWPLKMGPTGYFETSIRDYHFTPRKITQEHRSQSLVSAFRVNIRTRCSFDTVAKKRYLVTKNPINVASIWINAVF